MLRVSTVIPQRELRNDISRVLARVRAGEEFTVTVNGEQVAELVPVRRTGSTARFAAMMAGRPAITAEQRARLDALDEEIEALDTDDDDLAT